MDVLGRSGAARATLVVVLLVSAPVIGDASELPLRPEAARLAAAPPELQARLRSDPFVYFRFVNTEWARRVCSAFQQDLHSFPNAILHGDPHVEQYAVTATERGLDDFDDAAHGPSVTDLVRFLGSVDLVARTRGWEAAREQLFDRFFDGYARALRDPAYLPRDSAVVKRLRALPARTRQEFFASNESLMGPLTPEQLASIIRSFELLEGLLRAVQPELPVGYMRVKKAGTLRIGVGSALTRKFLARVEGPTAGPMDDVFLEAKELSRLASVPCIQVPLSGEVFRVIGATRQIGRIRHEILLVLPRREDEGPDVRDWWVRSWKENYRELTVADLASAEELAEVVHDAGAQLGAANLRGSVPLLEQQNRQAELAAVRRLEARIRAAAGVLTDALLAGWKELRASQAK